MPIIVNKNEPKNLTPEELEQLKQLKFEYEGYIFQIEQIVLELENLTDDKNKIKMVVYGEDPSCGMSERNDTIRVGVQVVGETQSSSKSIRRKR